MLTSGGLHEKHAIKDKLTSPHSVKAYRGSRGIVPLILNLGARRR
jgi:hypothetical protein